MIIPKINKEKSKIIYSEKSKNFFKKRFALICGIAGGLLLLLISATVFALICTRPVTVEVMQVPDYSHIEKNPAVNLFCKIDTDLEKAETDKLGEIRVPLKFFGFLRLSSKVTVVDTEKPRIIPRNVVTTPDSPIECIHFVKKAVDNTDITYEFVKGKPDTSGAGDQKVVVRATDEGGNSTEFTSLMTVTEEREDLSFEYGVLSQTVEEHIRAEFSGITSLDISAIDGCGIFFVTGEGEDSFYFLKTVINDTVAPVADIGSYDILLGDEVTDQMIVKSITDFSKVTVEFLNRPDFCKVGEQEIRIRLTDEQKNVSEYSSFVRIHDIDTEITAEAKCQNFELSEKIFKNGFSKETLKFSSEYVMRDMPLGENDSLLIGKYNDLSITINVEDTVPPVITTKTVTRLLGNCPHPADFITSCYDTTEVKYSFKKAPDHNEEGTFQITVIATDLAGNTSEAEACVVFFVDREPPVIKGAKDISIILGEKPNYTKGISAYDSIWGNINVKVDSSAANTKQEGTYDIIYSATDNSGNTAVQTVKLTVRLPIRVCLNASNIMQKPVLPNGCEAVSLAIALRYAGYSVDPVALYDKYMPKSPYKNGDPWTTYVGNAKGIGLGCYAPCVAETGNRFIADCGGADKVIDISGQNISSYEKYIDAGAPVIIWGMLNMNGSSKIYWQANIGGKNVVWHFYSHCLVLIGYTDYTYIFCDPLKGIVEYSKTDVEKSFNANFKQACIIQ